MTKFLKENWIILVIGIFLMTSMALAIRNNYVIEENHQLQQQTELVRQRTQSILSVIMHGVDLGVRGFGLTKENNMLRPYEEAIQKTPGIFHELDSLLELQSYEGSALAGVKSQVDAYIGLSKDMVAAAQADSMAQFTAMLKQDKGYEVWREYTAFSDPLLAYEVELNRQAISNYREAIRNNLILQISILLFAMPLLYFFIIKMRKERDGRALLLKKVEENDREFVFNSGENRDASASEVNDTSIRNVKKASSFIAQLASGNYQVEWEELTPDNQRLNATTLAGKLLQLRDQLKNVKQEDEKRNWVNEGLTSFTEIIRTYQHDIKALTYQCVLYFSNYLKAQQAGLFTLEGEEDPHLELAACYAYQRRKFLTKRINIGDGLIGQTYLEREIVKLKEIPNGYTHITSGLGEATPRYLVIVPFKYEAHTPALIELSSFNDFEEHHLEFLKKAGEYMAAAIISSQNTSKMQVLLEKASYNAKQMRQREEELSQNMEELTATQEEMQRKSNELNHKVAEMDSIWRGINTTMATIEFTLEGIVVDANENFLTTMKYSLNEIRGKHHQLFVPAEIKNSEAYQLFWKDLARGKSNTSVFKRIDATGKEVWLNAIYNPILDKDGNVVRVIKLATDITSEKEKEMAVKELLEETKASEEELRQNMEELSATQEEMERKNKEINVAAAEMRSVFNGINATMATIEFTPQGVITQANANFLKAMQCTLGEIKGKHHRVFVPKNIIGSPEYQNFWSRLERGEAITDVFPRVTLKGDTVWLNAIYNPILNDQDEVIKVVKFATDVTESKTKEEEIINLLEESRAQEEELKQNMEEVTASQEEIERKSQAISEAAAEMQSIMNGINATMASIEFTTEGNILHANENFLDMMEYSLPEIKGKHHRLFMPAGSADTKEYIQFWEDLSTGKPRIDIFERMTQKNKPVLLNAIYNPVRNAKGDVVKIVKLATRSGGESTRTSNAVMDFTS